MPDAEPGFDEVLERLEQVIGRLADGSAPLDELVSAHEEAQRLIDVAQGQLRELMARLEQEA
ncbi:MAG TPA: exodeoxyribonuclease VII small subunit [Candidatus Dormibacteraeota bacterium]